MANRIYFHIGLHKTATTWLQRIFFPNLQGVQLVRSRKFEEITPGSSTLVVSSEELSGSLSRHRSPSDRHKRLAENLARIVEWAPRPAIIVGFREQKAWLASAYAQRAKKRFMNRRRFIDSFAREELSWCRTLALIEQSCDAVFPFLYEEMIYDPHRLVDDLCSFLGVQPLPNLDELLAIREQPSARSLPGQLVTRLFYQVSLTSQLHNYSKHLGARVDRYFAPRKLAMDPQLTSELHQDWIQFLEIAGKRRERDFSALAVREPDGKSARPDASVASSADNRPMAT